jgi:uncharacterized repeat protein (TIGR04076 family)
MSTNEKPEVGYRVEGEIIAVKGTCSWGHKVGDRLQLSGRDTAGLCGYFYHDVFPYLIMLQFGGGFPVAWGGPDVVELECMDKGNAVTIRLRRLPTPSL